MRTKIKILTRENKIPFFVSVTDEIFCTGFFMSGKELNEFRHQIENALQEYDLKEVKQ